MGIEKNLKNIRKNKGISQRELAALIGVTPQMISKIETNSNMPAFKTLVKIAEALKCSIDELVREV
jgi:transcriptional regulator with XRE-family HTH domain